MSGAERMTSTALVSHHRGEMFKPEVMLLFFFNRFHSVLVIFKPGVTYSRYDETNVETTKQSSNFPKCRGDGGEIYKVVEILFPRYRRIITTKRFETLESAERQTLGGVESVRPSLTLSTRRRRAVAWLPPLAGPHESTAVGGEIWVYYNPSAFCIRRHNKRLCAGRA